MKAFAVAILP